MAEKKTTKKTTKKPATKKTAKKKPVVKKVEVEAKKEKTKTGEYLQSIGRRKRSIAQVRLYKSGKGNIQINDREFTQYFPILDLQNIVTEPITTAGQEGKLDFTIKVHGGGIKGQAEAIRLGIARGLVMLNPTFKKSLKKPGFLTRDPRKKERKKPGLKGARRAPQWSKR